MCVVVTIIYPDLILCVCVCVCVFVLVQSAAQLSREYGIHSKEARKYIFGSLLDMIQVNVDTSTVTDQDTAYLSSIDRLEFVRLLSNMLTLDSTQRAHPRQALQMPFISMQHLAAHTHTPVVWEWIQCMQVCRHPSPPPPPTAGAGSAHLQQALGPIMYPQQCCTHMQLMPGAIIQPAHSNTVIPGSHLVCVCAHLFPCVLCLCL